MLKATYVKSSEKRESDRMQRDVDDLYNTERQFIPIFFSCSEVSEQ